MAAALLLVLVALLGLGGFALFTRAQLRHLREAVRRVEADLAPTGLILTTSRQLTSGVELKFERVERVSGMGRTGSNKGRTA